MFAILVSAGVLVAGLKILAFLAALVVLCFFGLVLVAFTPFLKLLLPPDDEELDAGEPLQQPRDTAVEHASP